jgi:hypothetical protein
MKPQAAPEGQDQGAFGLPPEEAYFSYAARSAGPKRKAGLGPPAPPARQPPMERI